MPQTVSAIPSARSPLTRVVARFPGPAAERYLRMKLSRYNVQGHKKADALISPERIDSTRGIYFQITYQSIGLVLLYLVRASV